MKSSVSKRGLTVIPTSIRKRYQIRDGDFLIWLDDGKSIRVVPVAPDPIGALRGSGRGERLLEKLLFAKQADRRSD